MRFEITFSIRT